VVEPHDRFPGVYIMRGKDDALLTKNTVPGESVYNEKRVSVEVSIKSHELKSVAFFFIWPKKTLPLYSSDLNASWL